MFTPEEIEKFKAEAFSKFSNGKPKYQQPAAYILMLNTGLRTGELLGLPNSDINLDKRFLEVRQGVKEVCNMLRRGMALEALNIREQDFPKFQEAVKKSALLYSTVCMDDTSPPGEWIFTVYFCEPDMAMVNNILSVTQINAVKAAHFRTAEEKKPAAPEAEEQDVLQENDMDRDPAAPSAVESAPEEPGNGVFRFVGEDGEYVKPADVDSLDRSGHEPRGLPGQTVPEVVALPEKASAVEHITPTVPGSRNESPSAGGSGQHGKEDRPEIWVEESLPVETDSAGNAAKDFRGLMSRGKTGPGRGPRLSVREKLAQAAKQKREAQRAERAGQALTHSGRDSGPEH